MVANAGRSVLRARRTRRKRRVAVLEEPARRLEECELIERLLVSAWCASLVGRLGMWHNADMSHMPYVVKIGERGRLVLPAPVRDSLGLEDGSQLLLYLDESGESVRLERARDVARSSRGMFADDSGRSLVDELLEERRAEAEHDAETLTPR
jgi:AbrB family looped-hinge helix DNA binding protein